MSGYGDIRRRRPAGSKPAVLLDFGSWRLTLREAVFSVLIAGSLAAVGFFAAGAIERRVHERQLMYRQAVQIDKNPDEFKWALDTDIGYLFAEGRLEAVDPVKHDGLGGEWFSIEADYQKYTMHRRTRAYTVTDAKGRARTKTRVETYWSWDTYDVKRTAANTVRFLGVEMPARQFVMYRCGDSKTVSIGGGRRIVFTAVPAAMDGTIFAKAVGRSLDGAVCFWRGLDLDAAYDGCVASHAKELFWIVWLAVIVAAVFAFFYAENRWLED